MPPQTATPGEASWDEVITAIAKREGVNPALAIAVAKKESSLNPTAIGDGGKAVGMFQLHQGAAADTGTKNRLDPIQNITGGVKYLKQLNDQFGGDVEKTLQAYNGGARWVTEGKVTPQAQAYASAVIAELSKGVRLATGAAAVRPVTPGRSTGYDPANAPKNVSMVKQAISGMDPRTPEGRVNWASTLASAAASIHPAGRIAPWIVRVLGPPIAAGVAGGTERAIEQKIGTTPADAQGGLMTGALQAGYEFAGQTVMWPFKRMWRAYAAPKVAKAATAGVAAEREATEKAGKASVTAVKERVNEQVEAARMFAKADARAARRAQQPALDDAARRATAGTTAVDAAAAAQVAAARTQAKELLAQAELDGAAEVRRITQQYDQLLGGAPSNTATAEAVGAVTRTGVRGGPKGAAQIALDMAGKKVAEAAKTGPPVTLAPLQEALEKMRGAAYPDGLLGAPDGAVGAAGDAAIASRPPNIPPAQKTFTVKEWNQHLAETQAAVTQAAIEGSPVSPLPKVLGLIQRAPVDAISFADAHKLKGLLDETVAWDKTAKRKLERITKGIRIALRESMRGNEAYDQATDAYQELIPIYREGIGQRIVEAAQKDPDALLELFKPGKALQAEAAKKLLLEQAAAGGNPQAGQQAWDAVRSAFTYRNVLNGDGGVGKLAERVHALVTKYPQFAKTMYGDEAGQQILTNLDTLGKAYNEATAQAAAGVASAKAAGTATVEKTIADAATKAAEAKTEISLVTKGARRASMEAVQDAKDAAAVRTRAVQRSGADAKAEATEAAAAANDAAKAKQARLKASSIVGTRDAAEQGADLLTAASPRTGFWFQARAALRLLDGPKAEDILAWASYSSGNTERMSKFLLGQLPDRGVALLLRDLAPILTDRKETTAEAR